MGALLAFSRAVDFVNEKIGRAMSWAILLAVLVSSINAVVRYAFNTSSNAWLEMQWHLFSAVFLLGAAYTFKQNEHIRIDIVNSRLSRRTRDIIDIVGHVFFLTPFALILVWLGVSNAWRSFSSGGGVSGSQFLFVLGLLVMALAIWAAFDYLPALRNDSDPRRRGRFGLYTAIVVAVIVADVALIYTLGGQINRFWEQSSSAGGLPTWPARFLIPLGFLSLLLQGFSELIKRIAIMQGRIPDTQAPAGAHGSVE